MGVKEKVKTGGTKSFEYSQKDMERIRRTDTKPTKDFKKAYKKWQTQQESSKEKSSEKRKLVGRNIGKIGLLFLALLALAGIVYWYLMK